MARVRWERLNHYRNQQTYQAIECDLAREAMDRQSKTVVRADEPAVEPIDERDPIEIARAANRALKGGDS